MKLGVLSNLNVLVVAPERATRSQILSAFMNQKSPLSSVSPNVAESTEDADALLQKVESFDVIVFVAESLTDERHRFLDKAFAIRQIPVVLVSSDEDLQNFCVDKGIGHMMEAQNIEPSVLAMLMNLAIEHKSLKSNVENLEEKYHAAEQRFRDVADNFADWLWEIDRRLKLTFTSSSKRGMEEVVVGKHFTECFLPEEANHIEDDFERLLEHPQAFRDREYWSFDAYGLRICWQVSGVPVFDARGHVTGFRGVARDVSTEKSSVDQLYYLANNDPLTGLSNRTRFTEELDRVVRKRMRDNRHGALLLFDIDRFRYLNETHGQQVGDRILVHVAQMLKSSLRANDMVGRVAGDDFAIALHDTNQKDAVQRAEALLNEIKFNTLRIDGKDYHLSATVGVVMFPRYGDTADELLACSAVGVQDARSKGPGNICVYDPQKLSQHDVTRRNQQLDFVTKCLREPEHRLILHYQPIVSLGDKGDRKERYEVLVRLIDDDQRFVSPVKFIEVAEEYGLVSQIDRIVARRALDGLQQWQKQGRDISLSVNISGRTFADEKAMADIKKEIEGATFKPGTFVIEITETAALKDMDQMRRLIGEFKELGVLFALDDCGVGYSSLNYIRELDLDYIKIDGSFIRDLHRSADDDAFVQAISDVAKRMNIRTVAEMVEEVETVEMLRKMGIDFAQGYLFAMPAPGLPEEFEEIQRKALH